jgi:hypothetical protein
MEPWERIDITLHGLGVIAVPLSDPEARVICRRWLEAFCRNVERQTGSWVHRGYRWHAYSYGHEAAIEGDAALDAYLQQPQTNLLAYFEGEHLLFDCGPARAPRLDELDTDVYVFPRTLDWSMAFTHERTAGLGPYFAVRAYS